jgi:two-component system OmpR family response regulator
LVEVDSPIAKLISRGLAEHGFYIDELAVRAGVVRRLRDTHYECLILDLMLPDIDGLDVLKDVRRAGLDVTVILVTARNELEDRLAGLELSADD